MRRVSLPQFGDSGAEPLWKRPTKELPAHMQTGLGGRDEPQQLKMFMSAGEIMDEFQPLDGDRRSIDEMEVMSKQHTRPSPGPNNRGSRYPVERRIEKMGSWDSSQGRAAYGNTTGGDAYQRSKGGTARKWGDYREESSEELWDRKVEESKMPPADYDMEHQAMPMNAPEMSDVQFGSSAPQRAKHEGTTTFEDREHSYYIDKEMQQDAKYEEKLDAYHDEDNSLYKSIGRGGVQKPISLNDAGAYSRFGSEGKPMIAGGHHRLAAQFDQDPDKLIPVLHFAGGTSEAKSNTVWKYS